MKHLAFIMMLTFCVNSYANPVTSGMCKTATRSGNSAYVIMASAMTSIYNAFPIKIGTITISTFSELEDISTGVPNSPVCICQRPPLFLPLPGMTVSFWEPMGIVETTAIPWCFPWLGQDLPVEFGAGSDAIGARPSKATSNRYTYQAHYTEYPVFAMLKLLTDIGCVDVGETPDMPYLSEIDPLWQNDIWASIIAPEVYLVANPVAQMACSVDSAAATGGFPIDAMWWCAGSWGSIYPLSQNAATMTAPSASALTVARLLTHQHRLLMFELSAGIHMVTGLCSSIRVPLMQKSLYSIFPLYPVSYPYRIPIGRASMLWEYGLDTPMVNFDVWAWAVYRKRDCCAL